MIKKLTNLIVLVIVTAFLVPTAVLAQQEDPGLQLGLVRNFGYGGLGKIQGNFTLKILDPPAGLREVRFYIDGKLLKSVDAEPYKIQFHTSNFEVGLREMHAVGVLSDGSLLESNSISKEFLSSDQAWGETQQIVGPILIGTAALTLVGVVVPLLANRKKEFVLGRYGPAGGVVCPRCELPFSRSVFGPNLLVGKGVRCPHCGKISILPQASRARLLEAESRYALKDEQGSFHPEKGELRKQLDDSRFED